jgi:hypothetical protein
VSGERPSTTRACGPASQVAYSPAGGLEPSADETKIPARAAKSARVAAVRLVVRVVGNI